MAAITDLLPANTSQVCSAPGLTALLNGYADRTDIAFAFRAARVRDDTPRDRIAQRDLIRAHFTGFGWKVPAMLAQLDTDDDFTFDRIDQIRLPTWWRGRVVLVGDAGFCVSPVAGMGGSLALIAAARLADAMRAFPDDHEAAFRAYHKGLRGFVDDVQARAALSGMATMFPADEDEIAERDRRLAAGEFAL